MANQHVPEGPGQIVLYDQYKPTLYEGNYSIEATQTIKTTDGQNLTIYNYDSLSIVEPPAGQPVPAPALHPQRFKIVAPQWKIDPKIVNSCYPPDGHADEGRILPHIVFNDPHLPWERSPFPGPPFPPAVLAAFDHKPWPPWIALVVFDPNELKVDSASSRSLGIREDMKQSHSGAYKMSVGDFLGNIKSKADYNTAYNKKGFKQSEFKEMHSSKEPVDVIFTSSNVLNAVCKHPVKFKYMCHVRKLDTHGLPDGAGEDNQGLYSICVSHRSGPIMVHNPEKPPAPRPQIVHLISIECLIDENGDLVPPANDSGTSMVGLVSLYSWTYLATPPSPNNLISIMKDLGAKKQPLMPPQPLLDTILGSAGSTETKKQIMNKKLHARLSQGYSMVRWRTATGEETAAYNRGPLTPNATAQTLTMSNDWPDSSSTGKEFQILDKSTGLMDLSYSSAWQLGKLLAISDTIFSSALLRFRSTLYQRAASQARLVINNLRSAPEILSSATVTTANVAAISKDSSNVPVRIPLASGHVAPKVLDQASDTPVFSDALHSEMDFLTGFRDGLLETVNYSLSASPDFVLIQNWIVNKLLLNGIPFHYLVTDPSHLSSTLEAPQVRGDINLSPEALRFFYIDNVWMDCLIDGALSTANHLDPGDDSLRREIKSMFNKNLIRSKRPIARYGFFLRSVVVKAIPDLRITARLRVKNSSGAWQEDPSLDPSSSPILRSARVDDHTMLVLLKCLPEDLHSIIISQPAHQQRYVAPLPPVHGEPYRLKRLYTSGAPQRRIPAVTTKDEGIWETISDAVLAENARVETWYNPRTRCIEVEQMTADLAQILPFSEPPAEFHAPIGSAVFSLELNDKSYYMEIPFPPGTTPTEASFVRQLWLRPSHAETALPGHPVLSPSPHRSAEIIPVTVPRNPIASLQHQLLFPFTPSAFSTPLVTGPRIEFIPDTPSSGGGPFLGRDRYILSIHPSYRPAAARPTIVPNSTPARFLFSAHDYLPAQTTRRVDLVFSLHRNITGMSGSDFVTSITIIIPIASSGDMPTSEPLLVGPYKGQGATMVHNRRLTPTLISAPGQLQITLKARNAAPSAERSLVNTQTSDASFVLKGCEIATVRTPVMVDVMGAGSVSRGLVKVGVLFKTRRLFPLLSPARTTRYAVDVVKKSGVELDASGQSV